MVGCTTRLLSTLQDAHHRAMREYETQRATVLPTLKGTFKPGFAMSSSNMLSADNTLDEPQAIKQRSERLAWYQEWTRIEKIYFAMVDTYRNVKACKQALNKEFKGRDEQAKDEQAHGPASSSSRRNSGVSEFEPVATALAGGAAAALAPDQPLKIVVKANICRYHADLGRPHQKHLFRVRGINPEQIRVLRIPSQMHEFFDKKIPANYGFLSSHRVTSISELLRAAAKNGVPHGGMHVVCELLSSIVGQDVLYWVGKHKDVDAIMTTREKLFPGSFAMIQALIKRNIALRNKKLERSESGVFIWPSKSDGDQEWLCYRKMSIDLNDIISFWRFKKVFAQNGMTFEQCRQKCIVKAEWFFLVFNHGLDLDETQTPGNCQCGTVVRVKETAGKERERLEMLDLVESSLREDSGRDTWVYYF